MSKNIHLNHVEDIILERGRDGGLYSTQILEQLIENKLPVTTKWDGNPAVVCGINPENQRFFVGTKASFNKKQPKICYTNEDIEQFYHEHQDLAERLKLCLIHLQELNIKTILQGEFMFKQGEVARKTIGEREYFAFQPNNICYMFPVIDPLVETASIGIIFHTRYDGSTLLDAVAHFDVDVSVLQHSPNVWIRNAQCNAHVKPSYEPFYIDRAREELQQISDSEFDLLFSKKTFIQLLKQYFNHLIRRHQHHYQPTLISFIQLKNERYVDHAKQLLPVVDKIVSFQKYVVAAKHLIIEQLESNKMYLTYDDMMSPTSVEGFVVITPDQTPIKLVNRQVFSYMNFKRFANEGSPVL